MKSYFPIFKEHPDLCYLDSASTALKPSILGDSIQGFYNFHNASVHRGTCRLAAEASDLYDQARETIASYLHVSSSQIAFTANASDALNKLAFSFRSIPISGILTSSLEHHSNFLPWMKLAQEKDCPFLLCPPDSKSFIDFDFMEQKLKEGLVSLVVLSALSNVLGEGPNLEKIVALAHQYHALVVFDGTQHVCHTAPVDLKKLGCDFYVFSAHKFYGPTGLGVLYARPPVECPFVGGGAIETVSLTDFTNRPFPFNWDVGTPPIAEVVSFAAVIRWLTSFSLPSLFDTEDALLRTLKTGLLDLGATIVGKGEKSLVSCFFESVHSTDLASLLGLKNICIRAGKHCAHPLHAELCDNRSTIRFSVGLYTTTEDISRTLFETKKSVEKLR